MCGITGFIDATRSSSANALRASAERMACTLRDRGPDDAGFWEDAETGVALGHRRLSILDLSPAGHQPMPSATGRYVVAFNGEIYNFADLRRELESTSGARVWRGHSDTEIMLTGFETWGIVPTLERMVGMFAIALWDRDTRSLHLARDRAGEKPLYYGWMGRTFLFGSQIKSMRAHPCWAGQIDRDALALYLRHNYIPTPFSIYRGVHKLVPGTLLTLTADDLAAGRTPAPHAYWSLRSVAEAGLRQPFAGGEQDATDELDSILRRAVREQMVADVPVGAFLSGGVDSSTIVALMQQESARPVKTFTIGFEEEGYNEAEHAKQVARHLGTEHTELYVTPRQALDVVPRLSSLYDEPFADSSQIPTFLVSQLARRDVTVSLSGDAGDELFGGYNRYFLGRAIWRRVGWMQPGFRRAIARRITAVSPAAWQAGFDRASVALPRGMVPRLAGDKMHKFAEVLAASRPEDFYHRLVSCFKQPAEVVHGAVEPATLLQRRDEWPATDDFTTRMMFLDSVTYLPDDILVKVDRAAMGVSLESRVPMLDHRVIEFAWRVPLSMKVRGNTGKWLLRQVLYRYVPRALIDRPKTGFGIPIDQWLRGPLRDWAASLLEPARLAADGFFASEPITALWNEHQSGRRSWPYHLWTVLMFQAWLGDQ